VCNESVLSIQNFNGFMMYLMTHTQYLGIYLGVATKWTGGGARRRRPYIWIRISPGSVKNILSDILDVYRKNLEEYRVPTARCYRYV
jgi:hypothetical protein